MRDGAASFFLLSHFAEFFEELARAKLAIAQNRLGAMLRVGDEPEPSEPGDLAARLSGHLAAVLHAQWKTVQRHRTTGEAKAYRMALYVMTALADELLILEVDWPGREVWLDVLLEHKFFATRDAGTRFFELARGLLEVRNRDALHVDLAAVLLMALQLGFKGRHRGPHGEAALAEWRGRLFQLIATNHAHEHGPAFPQALQFTRAEGKPARLAPLTRWYLAAGVAALGYLLLSTALWLHLIEPFRQSVGAG